MCAGREHSSGSGFLPIEGPRFARDPKGRDLWDTFFRDGGCLNRLRSRRRAARALETAAQSPAEPLPEPGQALERREAADALRGAVARLPSGRAELYQLRAGGLSSEELAQILAVPIGTAKSRIHDLVSRLREEMQHGFALESVRQAPAPAQSR
jgi:hypothetical protein